MIGVAAAIAAVLVVVSVVVSGGEEGSSPTKTGLAVQGVPQSGDILGSPDAKVTLIVYEDLQCPFCAEFERNVFPVLVDEYVRTGKVAMRFVGMTFLGDDSTKALKHVLAARADGKLWHLAELLYLNQGDENSGWVTDELLDNVAREAGLDPAKLATRAAGPDVERRLEEMDADAASHGIDSTPSFLVQIEDGEPYGVQVSSLTPDAFRPILDDALAG
jgi:protein-disulfide isomerase